MANLELFTVESDWFAGGVTGPVYERVVGLGWQGGELWARHTPLPPGCPVPSDPDQDYRQEEIGKSVHDVPELFGDRLTDFFTRYIMPVEPQTAYNCHLFANFIKKGNASVGLDGLEPSIEMGTIRTRPPLDVGTHASLGDTEMFAAFRRGLDHSVIGLGRKVRRCIQVQNAFGHIGVASYKNTLAAWGVDGTKPKFFEVND